MTRRLFDEGLGRTVPAYFANEQCDDYDRPRATWPQDHQQPKETTNERKQGGEDADHQRTTTKAP